MKYNLILFLFILAVIPNLFGQDGDKSLLKSIRSFGVLPENSPEMNKANLQKAIDWASATERGFVNSISWAFSST